MSIKKILSYLEKKELVLTTAESCTAGRIIHLLGKITGSGACLDAGYVVYSVEAKKRLLNVQQSTIDKYNLTSEEVAREMVDGALKDSAAQVGVATTGVAGPEPQDGIPKGTICFAWGFYMNGQKVLYSETKHFNGTRAQVLTTAAKYALIKIPELHHSLIGNQKKE
jgi:PncC family amidohydrolase